MKTKITPRSFGPSIPPDYVSPRQACVNADRKVWCKNAQRTPANQASLLVRIYNARNVSCDGDALADYLTVIDRWFDQ